VVAQAEGIQPVVMTVHPQGTSHLHMLFEVGAGKGALGIGLGLFSLGGAVHGAYGHVLELQLHLPPGVMTEGLAGVHQGHGVRQVHGMAPVGGAVTDERLQHLEGHAAGVKGLIAADLGPLEVEEDAAVGQIQAKGHLGVALVDPVADAHEAAQTLGVVEEVVVGRLVEVGLRAGGMGVVVLGPQVSHHAHHAGTSANNLWWHFSPRGLPPQGQQRRRGR
jgi:hypothetical protein